MSRPDRKKLSKTEQLRYHAKQQALRDYLEAFTVPDPNRNIHQPKDFLDTIIREIGAKDGVEHELLMDSWTEIAGEFIAKHATPHSLNRGVLTLKVVQPAMRFHLEEAKGKLLKNLQATLGKSTIRQVRFNLG